MKKDEEMKKLKEKVDQCQEEIEVLKPLGDLKEEISSLKVESSTIENEVQKMSVAGAKTSTDELQTINQSIKREDTMERIDNIEAVLFAHQNLPSNNEICLKWVMQDFLKMFHIGKSVFSPIFHTKMGGYSLQLIVDWSGPSKEKLGLYLKLHRGDTPHEFLQEFNTEFTMKIHGKNGVEKSDRFIRNSIDKFRETSFTIKQGEDRAEKSAGCAMLTAPYDDFVVNNSLIMSCILHL